MPRGRREHKDENAESSSIMSGREDKEEDFAPRVVEGCFRGASSSAIVSDSG